MPVLQNGWVFLGELGTKWVPASSARFTALDATSPQQLAVTAACAADEILRVVALKPMAKGAGNAGAGAGEAGQHDWTVVVHEVKCGAQHGEQHICIGQCK